MTRTIPTFPSRFAQDAAGARRRHLFVVAGWLAMMPFCAVAQQLYPSQRGSGPGYRVVRNEGHDHVVVPAGVNNQAGSRQSGLQLRIDAFRPGNFGYQWVRVKVIDMGPSTAARQITLRFRAGNGRTQGRNISVEQDGELPLGATQTTIDMAVPCYLDWQGCSLETWVDGRKDADLSVDGLPRPRQAPGEDLAVLYAPNSNAMPVRLFRDVAHGNVQLSTAELSELPTRWIYYSSLDVVSMPTDQFLLLASQSPERADALLKWVRTGGNLWLLDADSEEGWEEGNADAKVQADAPWAQLGAINAVLHPHLVPSGEGTAANASAASVARWEFLPLGDRAQDVVESVLTLDHRDEFLAASPSRSNAPEASTSAPAPPSRRRSRPWFQAQGYGMGVVLAVSEQSLRNRLAGAAIEDSLVKLRLAWSERHGLKPSSGSMEFNNWLLPGVGLAPVGMFQLLVTLFVLAMGPLNYVLLKRSERLPMLAVTAPLGAAAVTLLLFAYGLFADGFGVQVRARSLTILDQKAGEAAWWSRLSYYAAAAPDQGLSLPADVVIYPIEFSEGRSRRGRTDVAQRTLEWGDRQQLTRGWLAPRTPTQYLQVGARPTTRRLEIATSGDRLRVKNLLGVHVLRLAVEDDEGKTFWFEDLAPDQQQTLPPVDPTAAMGPLRQIFSDNELAYPPGAAAPLLGGGFYGGPLMSASLLESYLSALNSPLARRLGPRRYLAVTDMGIELDVGIADAAEDASFHVIKGSW